MEEDDEEVGMRAWQKSPNRLPVEDFLVTDEEVEREALDKRINAVKTATVAIIGMVGGV